MIPNLIKVLVSLNVLLLDLGFSKITNTVKWEEGQPKRSFRGKIKKDTPRFDGQ